MHTSAVLVMAAPELLERCLDELSQLPGVEVHHVEPETGRLIATQESVSLRHQAERLRQIQALPTVRLAEWVYHHFDSESGVVDPERHELPFGAETTTSEKNDDGTEPKP